MPTVVAAEAFIDVAPAVEPLALALRPVDRLVLSGMTDPLPAQHPAAVAGNAAHAAAFAVLSNVIDAPPQVADFLAQRIALQVARATEPVVREQLLAAEHALKRIADTVGFDYSRGLDIEALLLLLPSKSAQCAEDPP